MRLDPSQEPNEGPANGGPQETLVHGAAETQQLDRQLPSCCPQLSAAHPLPAHCRAGHRAVSQAGLRCIPQRHQRGVQVGRLPVSFYTLPTSVADPDDFYPDPVL